MPYKIKGRCIYRKDTGKKVGCTKGSVKKYMAALHTNVVESTNSTIVASALEFKGVFTLNESTQHKMLIYKIKAEPNVDMFVSFISKVANSVYLKDHGDIKGKNVKLINFKEEMSKEVVQEACKTLKSFVPRLYNKLNVPTDVIELFKYLKNHGLKQIDNEEVPVLEEELQFDVIYKKNLTD
jgi:hypothetical protein